MSISRRQLLVGAAAAGIATQIPLPVAIAAAGPEPKPDPRIEAIGEAFQGAFPWFTHDLHFREDEFTVDLSGKTPTPPPLGYKVYLKKNPDIPLVLRGVEYAPHWGVPYNRIKAEFDLDDLLSTPMGVHQTTKSFTTGIRSRSGGDPRLIVLAGRALGIEDEVRHHIMPESWQEMMGEPWAWQTWQRENTDEGGWRRDLDTGQKIVSPPTKHSYMGRRRVFNHLDIPLTVGITHYWHGDHPPWLTFWFELGTYESQPPDDKGRSHEDSAFQLLCEHSDHYRTAKYEILPGKLWKNRAKVTYPEPQVAKAIEQLRCLPWKHTGLSHDEIAALLKTNEGSHKLASFGMGRSA